MNYVVHDENGEILRRITVPDSMLPQENWLKGYADDLSHYVLNGEIVERPAMPAGLSGMTISGVPAGAVLTIDSQPVGMADGTPIDLSFDLPGDYRFTAELFPYITYEATVHAD